LLLDPKVTGRPVRGMFQAFALRPTLPPAWLSRKTKNRFSYVSPVSKVPHLAVNL